MFSTPSAYTRAECSNPTWLAYVGTATCRVLLLTAAFWLRRWSLVLRFLDTVKAFLLYLVLPLNGKSCCVWCCHSMANHAVFGAATQSGSRLSLLAPALLALVPLVLQPVLFSTPSAYTRAECSNPTWLASVGTATCPTRALSVSFLIHSTYRMATLRHL